MSELESVLNYLETTSMEPHDDYTSEFSYKEQKVLWKYIKQLQQENKEYKEVIDKAKNKINEYKTYCEKNKGFDNYTDIEIEAVEPVLYGIEEVLKEGKIDD